MTTTNKDRLRETPVASGRLFNEEAEVVNIADFVASIVDSLTTGIVATINEQGYLGDAAKVSGLAGNPIRISAGETYVANPVKGFRILLKGTGDLSFIADFTGATTETITAAELSEMSTAIYHDWPIPCSSITAGAPGSGMEILAYI